MGGEGARRGRSWRAIEDEQGVGRRERMERQRRLKEERFAALEDRRGKQTDVAVVDAVAMCRK